MDTWPDIDMLSGVKVTPIKKAHRQVSAAGYTLSRASGTVLKNEFALTYSAVSSGDKATVVAFFDTNQGISFVLNDPDPGSSETFTVVFGQDEIEFELDPDFPLDPWGFTVKMKEV